MQEKWTEYKVIEEIRERLRQNRGVGNKELVQEGRSTLYAAGRRFFGTWAKAVEAAKSNRQFEETLHAQELVTKEIKERIIQEIQERYRTGKSLRYRDLKKEGKLYYHESAIRYFGGWDNALKEAGVDPTKIERPIRRTREQLIVEIRQMYQSGASLIPKNIEVKAHRNLYVKSTSVFGSWKRAIEAAGIDPEKVGVREPIKWTEERVVQELQARYRAGEPLNGKVTHGEWRHSLYNPAVRVFGDWETALKHAGIDINEVTKRNTNRERREKEIKEKVIAKIQVRHEKGQSLKYGDLEKEGLTKLYDAGIRFFGSWRETLKQAGIDVNEHIVKERWTKEKFIMQIQERHRNNKSLRYSDLKREGIAKLYHAGLKLFGSWREALKQSGVVIPEGGESKHRTREQIIKEVQQYHKEGKPLKAKDVLTSDYQHLYYSGVNFFGSWKETLELAGVDTNNPGVLKPTLTREQVIQEIQERYNIGKTLLPEHLKEDGKTVLYRTGIGLFGTWKNAVISAGYDPKDVLMAKPTNNRQF